MRRRSQYISVRIFSMLDLTEVSDSWGNVNMKAHIKSLKSSMGMD